MADDTHDTTPAQDAGAQQFTTSSDGYLVGGNPELGDVVHDEDGGQLGPVAFFYDQLDATHYRVQVAHHAEDPVLVQVETVQLGKELRHRLVARAGAAASLPVTGGAVVRIDPA